MNIFDYIHWRGDLTFDERGLNEIDSLILCELAYENFESILDNCSRSLNECAQLFFTMYDEETLKNRKTLTNESYLILKAVANTKRYQDLIVSNYVNEIVIDQDLQFSAITFQFKDKWKYVAFRGTDDTFTGWKEDFMMTYKEEVLSQRKAVEYLNKISNEDSLLSKLLNRIDYYIGGHSKGGNLAMYASAHVPSEVQNRIRRIDNFDGPGFEKKVWEKESIKKILPLIHTYIPPSSLFGRVFDHPEQIHIVKSSQVGLLQHDALNWKINVQEFKYVDTINVGSEKAVNKLNEVLNEMNVQEREELVESLFDIFENLQIYTFADLSNIDVNRILHALKDFSELNHKQRKTLLEFIKVLWDITDIPSEVKQLTILEKITKKGD